DGSGESGPYHRARLGGLDQPCSTRVRRARVLRLRHGARVHGDIVACRRPLDNRPVGGCLLQDEGRRSPSGLSCEVQRHRGSRVDERIGRRVGSRLGLPQSHAHARRLCVRGCLCTGTRSRRWSAHFRRRSPQPGLVHAEPSRYGTLHHPGDPYALDMYAQIGRALRATHPPAVLGPLHARHVVALGESQSAFFLTTFADAIQPRTHAYDGIFIHSRGGGGTGIADGGSGLTGDLRIRTDLTVPVFMFETQTDLTTLGYAAAQQPNTERIRTWEVAGTSHADAYLVGSNATTLGCTQPINDGPQHTVVQAAFTAFDKWVTHDTPPPSPSPFDLASTSPTTYALDKYGNVIGGVRTPAVDVPVSTLS